MKKVFLGLVFSALLAYPFWAALKVADKAPDFSARASLAGKEFNFSLQDALKKARSSSISIPPLIPKAAILKRIRSRRRKKNSMRLAPPSLEYRPTASRGSMRSRQTRIIAPESFPWPPTPITRLPPLTI